MSKNRNALRAGIFIVISAAAAIIIVLGVAGSATFTQHFAKHLVKFSLQDNLGGLQSGDDLRLGGLKIGSVERVDYVRRGSRGPDDPPADEILVTLSMPSEYILATDATVNIETSLTGVTDMNISDLGVGDPLAAGEALAGHPNATSVIVARLAAVLPKLTSAVDKAYVLLDTWDKLGTDTRGRVSDIASHVDVVLDDVHTWLGPNTGEWSGALKDIHAITTNVREKLPPVITSVQQALDHANDVISKLQGMMDDVKVAVANLKDTTANLQAVMARNHSRLDELVTGVKEAADNLRTFSAEVAANPSTLLWPRPQDNQNVYNAARQFAEGANALSDAANDLRAALQEPQPDAAKVQKMYDNLTDQFTKFRQTEDNLWKQVGKQ